jgi:hypothetical protein
LGGTSRTIEINAGPRQYFESYANGNGWSIGLDTDTLTTTSDGDSVVENSDTFIQVTSG